MSFKEGDEVWENIGVEENKKVWWLKRKKSIIEDEEGLGNKDDEEEKNGDYGLIKIGNVVYRKN